MAALASANIAAPFLFAAVLAAARAAWSSVTCKSSFVALSRARILARSGGRENEVQELID